MYSKRQDSIQDADMTAEMLKQRNEIEASRKEIRTSQNLAK